MATSPTPDQIRAARGSLSQTAAAALIGKSLRCWQNWEQPTTSKEHRQMDAALFELFLIKLQQNKLSVSD
jgi:DNA-binding transcriptional regulator YiaG